MVRKKMKAKKVMLSSDKVDYGKVETDFVQCLEDDETDSNTQEFMNLYEEHVEINGSKPLSSLNNMEKDNEDIENDVIVSSPIDELRQCSQELLLSSVEVDEEMAQCVPELPESPLLCGKVSQLKENRRPKFKTTPTRKEVEKEKLKKKKKRMKLSNVGDDETKTKMKNTKNSETADEDLSCSETKNKEGSWIQCSRVDCLKWRKLPDEIEPTTITDRWVCAMNPDESRMECAASQETCDSQIDYDVVYTEFVPGSLVWAKVPGYPWWPAMVENDPDYNCCYETDDSDVNPTSYHVSFVFDKDVSRSWVTNLSIRSFSGTDNPNEASSKFKKNSKSLTKALAQARSAIHLPVKERLKKFSFCVLYKGPIAQTEEEEREDDQISNSILSDDKERSDKVKKNKKPKALKKSPAKSNDKMKSSSKVAEGRMEEDAAEDYGENTAEVEEDMENVVKKKKKRKRIIESSEDERKESICETDKGASNAAAGETFDHKSKKGKTTKKLVNNKDLFTKTDNVKEITSPCERETREDISHMEAEVASEGKATNENESEWKKTVKKDGNGNKLKRKQAKKLKETGRKNKESESVGKMEKEGSITIKKKKKKKAIDIENKKDAADAPSMENKEKREKAKQGNPKSVQTEKKKQAKEKETSTVNEKSEGVKKKKKKKIFKDVFKPNTSSLTNETSSSNKTMEPKVEDCGVQEEYTVGDKLIFRDSSSEEEGMASKDKIILSSTKRIIECGTSERKKTKKLKKANFIASSNKALGSAFSQGVTDHVNSSTVSQKKIKSGTKSLHKKTRPVFGKFRAPVKQNQSVLTSQGGTKGKKTLKKHGSEKKTTPDKLPSDLDNYVSIETLEKDINNLYQELSEGETSGLLEDAGKEDEEAAVSMDFFHDELTLDVKGNDPASRCLTNSPEY